MTRKIGLEGSKACLGLKNLTFNFLRYLLRADRAFEPALEVIYLRSSEPPSCHFDVLFTRSLGPVSRIFVDDCNCGFSLFVVPLSFDIYFA